MIICDNCKKNITPTDEEEISDRNILNLREKKICLCTSCFEILSNWACSSEHQEATKKYREKNNLDDELEEPVDDPDDELEGL